MQRARSTRMGQVPRTFSFFQTDHLILRRYKHNQQLEELRVKQEQLAVEQRSWARQREEQEREMQEKMEAVRRDQATMEQERKDVEQQRNKSVLSPRPPPQAPFVQIQDHTQHLTHR